MHIIYILAKPTYFMYTYIYIYIYIHIYITIDIDIYRDIFICMFDI